VDEGERVYNGRGENIRIGIHSVRWTLRAKKGEKMPSKSIFISHAVNNKEIADSLVDLFETGIGISSNEIFCSSLEGLGIPSGVNFVSFIKDQILNPKVVILLLTPDYLNSQFCLCELGASWALSTRIIPIIVPPITYQNIKAVLTGVQLLRIENKEDLNQMQQDLIDSLSIEGKSFSRWEIKRDAFLQSIITKIPVKTIPPISHEEYSRLHKNYSDATNEIKNLIEENDKKDDLIKKISALKDAEKVKSIVKENDSEESHFNELIEAASSTLGKLPRIVRLAFFYDRTGELLWGKFDRSEYDDIHMYIDEDYLIDNDPAISLNYEDPKIQRADKALDALRSFIEGEISEELFSSYKDEYDHVLKFTSKRFWEQHLI